MNIYLGVPRSGVNKSHNYVPGLLSISPRSSLSTERSTRNEHGHNWEKIRRGKVIKRTMDPLQPDRYQFISLELLEISCHVASSEFEA